MINQAKKLILIVDDQEEDQGVLAWTLEKLDVANPVFCLRDGFEAIRYLNGESPYNDRSLYPFPAIMFLDLKMPMNDGWQVLASVKQLSLEGKMRIFIYSELHGENEVKKLYTLGADSFVRKPVVKSEVLNLVQQYPAAWEMSANAG
jgi:two-component system response regulator